MLHRDYQLLKYDSFLSASSVIERRLSVITEGIKNRTTTIIGKIKAEHLEDLVKMLRQSKVISERHKPMFFY